ncbi:MAG: DNA-directed RNA polymerase subunit omega [Fusobacterium sp.]|uniref:DNA-directed RNA polymerase subunit omega n=1 Tax=Fusobacterium sp. TaxID=68766 RepID=UPI0026DB336F|nr:DNA-directed RNA polymerase subunit omega [Fusobacterium sp.]MDO4690365.1 DNA-directed RNA polymerase subunit omega [Fusobacterium sp.]
MKKVITYDELLDKIPNKYILTIVSGERARARAKEKMEKGAEPKALIKYEKKDTEMKKVFKEILAGKVGYED